MSSSSKVRTKGKDEKKKSKLLHQKLTDLEKHVILRMPEPYAATLRDALQNGGLKDRLKIQFADDGRHAQIKFDNIDFSAKLYDLPCILESWKTFDKKSLWKTGDVGQLLICRHPDDPDSSGEEEDNIITDYFKKKQEEARKYKYPHGITPPLKNVKKRRFRKTAKQKYVDAPEIEKEVKRLLRADVSAVDVKFDILNDELEKQMKQEEEIEDEVDVGGEALASVKLEYLNDYSNMSSVLSSDNEATGGGAGRADILPDISSSEDEDDNIKNLSQTNLTSISVNLNKEYEIQLKEIKAKKVDQEMRVMNAANPFLKQRFQLVLDSLNNEEEEIYAKINPSL